MLVIKDFATTTIASALTAAATSIVVSDASRLPALSAGDHFDLVLQKFTDRNYVEIVRVTGVSGNTLTVARGRDGTMGRAFSIGDYAEVRLTVGVFSTYVSQLVEGKVDKDFSYVNQRLQVVNTGDLVGASLALLYAAGTGHGTIVSGGEGVNKQTPYIALRPLGHANAATQLKYTDGGSLSLVGGTRSASFGFILSEHSFDSNGFPNAVSNDANNYINRARSKITAGNSGLHFLADAALNARRFGIQSGHSLSSDATSYGILDLNPFGGVVRVNGGTVYHTGYVPTPAAVGALALSGGTLTGNFDQNFGGLGYGFRFTVSGSLVYFQGGKRDGDEADQKLRISGYLGKPLTEFNILTAGHGIALVNGARLYTEQYLPTPDVLGCVPSARTINSKPLSADVVLTPSDVGAAPAGFGLGAYGASLTGVSADTALLNGFYGVYSGTTETPFGSGPSGSTLLSLAWGPQGGNQLFFSYTSDRVFSRRRYTGVMQPWFEFYTSAHKPTAEDLGFYPAAGGDVTGSVYIKNPLITDPITMDHVFPGSGSNAQGISGFKAGTPAARVWGAGVFAVNATPDFAYFGFGVSPWATGLKVKADGSSFSHPLTIETAIGQALVLKAPAGGDGSLLRGMEGTVLDWYVGRANAAGDVALFSNKHSSGLVVRSDSVEFVTPPRLASGYLYGSKPLGTLDLNTLSASVDVGIYYQDSNAQATAGRNYPTQEAGSLMVVGGPYGVQHEYTTFSSGRKFVRGKSGVGGFFVWKEINGSRHHISGRSIAVVTIPVGGATTLRPTQFDSTIGISQSDGTYTVSKSTSYRISFGFSLDPVPVAQQCIAELVVNGVIVRLNLAFCYMPVAGAVMATSSYEGVVALNAGDSCSIRIRTVNSTTAKIYTAGYFMLEEM